MAHTRSEAIESCGECQVDTPPLAAYRSGMTAFQVMLNGKPFCLAGLPGPGVVSVILDRLLPAEENSEEHLSLSVGWLDSLTKANEQGPRRDLQEGDEITIRVVKLPGSERHRD
jgi:hypothetical protein